MQMSTPSMSAVAPGHRKMVLAQAAAPSFSLVRGMFPSPPLATGQLAGKLVQGTDL